MGPDESAALAFWSLFSRSFCASCSALSARRQIHLLTQPGDEGFSIAARAGEQRRGDHIARKRLAKELAKNSFESVTSMKQSIAAVIDSRLARAIVIPNIRLQSNGS